MNWFKCDNDGNILINMHNILKILQNTSIPNIKKNQTDILSAIQDVLNSSSNVIDISQEQLNLILSAIQSIPSDTIVDNQNNIISGLNISKSNTDDSKVTLTDMYKKIEYSVSGTLIAGETSITLKDNNIKEDTDLTVYTSQYNLTPTLMSVTNGSVTLTFDEQTKDLEVRVTFKRDVNWTKILSVPIITTIDGMEQTTEKDIIFNFSKYIDENVNTLPYNFYNGSAIVYNNEIHILGSNNSSSGNTKHYKYDGSTWTNVSTLPYNFDAGSAVVYNNEIHILGGWDGDYKYHYKYDGSTWTNVSTLPYNFHNGSAVVLNNEIHILGSGDRSGYTKHYKYDGSTWTNVSTLPYNFYNGSAVVLNNEIHILGSNNSSTYYKYHYKYDGSTWTNVSTLPYNFYYGSAIILNNEIHILGSYNSSTYYKYHYKYDGSTWTSVSTLPYNFYEGSAVVLNNEIHILGSYDSSYRTKHYIVAIPVYKRIQ